MALTSLTGDVPNTTNHSKKLHTHDKRPNEIGVFKHFINCTTTNTIFLTGTMRWCVDVSTALRDITLWSLHVRIVVLFYMLLIMSYSCFVNSLHSIWKNLSVNRVINAHQFVVPSFNCLNSNVTDEPAVVEKCIWSTLCLYQLVFFVTYSKFMRFHFCFHRNTGHPTWIHESSF